METAILISLLIVIVLLLQDKVVIKRNPKQEKQIPIQKREFLDIMGKPKPIERLSPPKNTTKGQLEDKEEKPDNFEEERSLKGFAKEIPQEELDEVFNTEPDLEEEEEEWNGYGTYEEENGFATGVTFEELSTVGMLLQKEKLETAQKETAVGIVQKIQGTDLFSLLENSMEGAAQKIAALLDSGVPGKEMDSGSSNLRKNNINDFDIGEFV